MTEEKRCPRCGDSGWGDSCSHSFHMGIPAPKVGLDDVRDVLHADPTPERREEGRTESVRSSSETASTKHPRGGPPLARSPAPGGEGRRWTRDNIVTVAMALDEFRDTGVPELRDRANALLRTSVGDSFVFTEAEAASELQALREQLATNRYERETERQGARIRREALEAERDRLRERCEEAGCAKHGRSDCLECFEEAIGAVPAGRDDAEAAEQRADELEQAGDELARIINFLRYDTRHEPTPGEIGDALTTWRTVREKR